MKYKRLETLTLAVTKHGHHYLEFDLYYKPRPTDRPVLYAMKHREIDGEDYVRLSVMLREGRLYTNE